MNPAIPPHVSFVRTRLAPLVKLKDDYVSPDYLDQYAIKCRGLDFYNGTPLDPRSNKPVSHAEKFTQLIPYERMNQSIQATQPWKDPDYGDSSHLGYWDPGLDNWWYANKIGERLNMFLFNHYKARTEHVMGVIGDTKWDGMA